MTGRDLRWRAGGLVLAASAAGGSFALRDGSPLVLLCFLVALLGIVLLLNGKRVAVAWRAERHGHAATAAAIHAQRVEHLRRKADPTRR